MAQHIKDQQGDNWREMEFGIDKIFYFIAIAGMLILFGVWLGTALFDADSILPNVYTEVLSIGVTVLILNKLAERREENALKRRLIMNAGSLSNEIAKDAVHQIRRRDWLSGKDGILKRAYLWEANLERANLNGANLENTRLFGANLESANLSITNLQDAILRRANLQNADLASANLENTDLFGAILQGAKLERANLQSAKLLGADLKGSKLEGSNLQDANLYGAYLQDADLKVANLERADLRKVNLQGALLMGARLRGADMGGADLQGADLMGANLQGASLAGVKLDAETILPDGSRYDPDKGLEQLDPFIKGQWYQEAESEWAKWNR
jgi:uncharacterized protein YjbI with pentapeptide repeats